MLVFIALNASKNRVTMIESTSIVFPIESFAMKGVYGYKNLSMTMKGKTTIFVSENGSGKTTILNALNYLLKGNYHKLKNLSFNEIEIKIHGQADLICFSRESIKTAPAELKDILSDKLGIIEDNFWDENELEDILEAINSYKSGSHEIIDNNFLRNLYNESHYQMNEFIDELKNLKSYLISYSYNNLDQSDILSKLSSYLSNYDVIYLPTYRRVEKLFDKETDISSRRRMLTRREKRKHFNEEGISYGLKDVEEILSDITLNIERESSIGYRSLSATMLDDLIEYKDRIREADNNYTLPAIDDLARFLSRLDKPEIFNNQINSQKEKHSPLINSLSFLYENNRISENHYLSYFLSKLNPIIESTKEQESKIETFVEICNKYLKSAGDSKFLTFDPSKLEVIVYDDFSKERIRLNDLSSGEKQVISLMSILYLYENKNKIILIDEPELSLSLPWQRLLLPDVDKCNTVSQVIAITHSPFIFDNELSANATPMHVLKKLLKNG